MTIVSWISGCIILAIHLLRCHYEMSTCWHWSYIYTCFNVVYGSALIHHVYISMACSFIVAVLLLYLWLQSLHGIYIYSTRLCTLYFNLLYTTFCILIYHAMIFFLTAVVHSCLLQSTSYLWHLYLLHLYYIIAWFLLNGRG